MKQFVYILTDSNRNNLHVGLTHDLKYTMNYYKDMYSLFFDSHKKASRLVYFEEVFSTNNALERFKIISEYTRSQKERIIRLNNANWIDLSLQSNFEFGELNALSNYHKQAFAS